MPVFLVIVFCLISDSSVCVDVRPNMADDFPLAGIEACMHIGERIAVEYVAIHPKWHLDRVKCRIGVAPREQDAMIDHSVAAHTRPDRFGT